MDNGTSAHEVLGINLKSKFPTRCFAGSIWLLFGDRSLYMLASILCLMPRFSIAYLFDCLIVCSLACLFICLFVYSFVHMFAYLFVCSFVRLFVCLSVCLSVRLFVCWFVFPLACSFVCWFICVSVCLSVCLSVWLFLFICKLWGWAAGWSVFVLCSAVRSFARLFVC